jgi:hypothetical protein
MIAQAYRRHMRTRLKRSLMYALTINITIRIINEGINIYIAAKIEIQI